MKKKVFQIANALVWEKGWNRSEATKHAWKIAKLHQAMKAGAVEFTYEKSDGTQRPAKGTIDPTLFSYRKKSSGRKKNPLQVPYFDLEKNAWRSFSAYRQVSA